MRFMRRLLLFVLASVFLVQTARAQNPAATAARRGSAAIDHRPPRGGKAYLLRASIAGGLEIPRVMEFTFLRRERVKGSAAAREDRDPRAKQRGVTRYRVRLRRVSLCIDPPSLS